MTHPFETETKKIPHDFMKDFRFSRLRIHLTSQELP